METLEILLANGWQVDPGRGGRGGAYRSVSLCLHLEGRRHYCVPGHGRTLPLALLDAANVAASWIRRQPRTHPLFSHYPASTRL